MCVGVGNEGKAGIEGEVEPLVAVGGPRQCFLLTIDGARSLLHLASSEGESFRTFSSQVFNSLRKVLISEHYAS